MGFLAVTAQQRLILQAPGTKPLSEEEQNIIREKVVAFLEMRVARRNSKAAVFMLISCNSKAAKLMRLGIPVVGGLDATEEQLKSYAPSTI